MEILGAGVMRVFQQAGCKRIIRCSFRVTEHTGEQARKSIDEDQCREFAAGQHVITDGDFIRDQVFTNPFVYTLVATTEKSNMRVLDQFKGYFLVEDASLGGKHNDRAERSGSKNTFNSCKDRFHFHHHPTATSIRFIVCDMVLIPGKVADIMDTYINQSTLTGALQNTTIEIWGENFREQRENIKLHVSILVDCGLSDKRGAGIDARLQRMVR